MSVFGTPQTSGTSAAAFSTSILSNSINTVLGDLIVVCYAGLNAATGCSDTAGNSFTALASLSDGSGDFMRYFYCLSATFASASNVITVTMGTAIYSALFVWDFPLTGTVTFDIDSALQSFQNSNPALTAAFNTAGTDELVLTNFWDYSAARTFTAASGWTLDNGNYGGGPGNSCAAAHRILTSPQTAYQAPWPNPSGDYLTPIQAISFTGASSPIVTTKAVTVCIMQ